MLLSLLLLLLLLGLLLSLLLCLLLSLHLSLLLRLYLGLLLLLMLVLLLLLMLVLCLLLLLEGGWHRLSALLLLLHVLDLRMCGHGVRELVLGGGRCRLGLGRHLLGSLRVVEGRGRHVGIVVGRLRGLRRVGLRRREVGARSADVAYSRVRSRQVVRRLWGGPSLLEGAVADWRRHGRRAVSYVLELRVLHVMGHHRVLGRGVRVPGQGALVVLIILVVAVLLAHEVLWTLVLVGSAILRDLSVSFCFSAALDPGSSGMPTYWYRPIVSLMSPEENS